MPAVTDNFCEVAVAGSETTLASPGKAVAATSINLMAATGWPTVSAVIFALRRVDASGNYVPGTYTEWIGLLSGTTISGLTGTPLYGTDQSYAADGLTQVYIPLSASLWNRLILALLQQHNQDGSHKSLTTDTLLVNTSIGLPNNVITAAMLGTAALLLAHVDLSGSNFSTGNTTDTQVTGATATVTIPAGGREIEVYMYMPAVSIVGTNLSATFSIWDGVVGSGTKLAEYLFNGISNGLGSQLILSKVVTPSAGSKTYNVGVRLAAGGNSLTVNGVAYDPYLEVRVR